MLSHKNYQNIKKFLYKHRVFVTILLVGLLLRVLLNTAVDSFDFYAFVMWAKYLTAHRMADVFEFLPDGYTPYPPVYYYVLALLGKFITFINVWNNKWLTYLIIRIPVFSADVVVASLIYWFANKFMSRKDAVWGVGFYFLHPVSIYNTSVWGQIDAIVTMLGLLSINAFIAKKYFWGFGIYVIGVLTKLQILALLPLIGFLTLLSFRIKQLFKTAVVWGLLATLPFLPIIAAKGLGWTWSYFFTIPNWYAYTSVYTYNLWAPFGFIVSDNTLFLGLIPYKYVGIALFWVVAALILWPLRQKKLQTPLAIMFAGFLLWYDFSFFATRIHSRYLIYSFGFFAPFFRRYPRLGILLSSIMIANLVLPAKIDALASLTNFMQTLPVISVFVIFAFGIFLYGYKTYQHLLRYAKNR